MSSAGRRLCVAAGLASQLARPGQHVHLRQASAERGRSRAWLGYSLRLMAAALLVCPPSAWAATVYVTSQEAGDVAFIDTVSGVRRATVRVGDAPAGIAVSPDGRRAYVSHPDASAITAIDTASASVIARWTLRGMPFGIAVSADGRSLYVTDWTRHAVLHLDAESGAELGQVPVGKSPAGIAFDADCRRLFVADRESGTMSVIDAASLQRVAQIPVGDRPFAVTEHAGRIYAANVKSHDVAVIDATTLAVQGRVALGGMPYGVAADARDGRVWVTEQQSGTLVGMAGQAPSEPGTPETAAPKDATVRLKVGKYPEGLAIVDGKAYVANWFDDAVAIVDLASAQIDGRIKLGAGPRMVAIAPTCTTTVANARSMR